MFDGMKRYIGWTVADEERLRALWPVIQPHVVDIVDRFYARIESDPAARQVIADEAQRDRLKQTLRIWLQEMLTGPWDKAYFARRERIGRVHVDVRLPPRFMHLAMSGIRHDVSAVLWRQLPPAEVQEALCSLHRATELDLAAMTGTYMDVRQHRQLGELQELIVSHLPVTVMLLDAGGNVVAATRPSARLFGETPLEGRHLLDALPEGLVAALELEQLLERAAERGREITVPRVDCSLEGRERSFSVNIVPLVHPNADLLVHLEDLTEVVEAEARLQRNENLARIGSMSAAVAHELRNPLAGISGAVQIIVRSMPEDDDRRRIMEKVQEQIQRLNALVTDLLAYSRPSRLHVEGLALREVAGAAVELVDTADDQVVIDIQGSGRALADSNAVHRIVLNLVQNAAQALTDQRDGGRVEVRIDEGVIQVSDNGPGIPEPKRDEIFEPFFTTRTRGTGLGLAICRKSAEEMGGQLLLAEDGALGGATFRLELRCPD